MVSTFTFLVSQLLHVLLRVETLLLVLCIISLLALRRGNYKRANRRLTLLVVLMGLLSFVPVANFVLPSLETAYPASPETGPVEGIIVLGGGEAGWTRYGQGLPQINHAGDRFLSALRLAHMHPEATVIFAGGTPTVTPASGTDRNRGRDILLGAGLSPDRLIVEGRSRNTAENAALTREVAPAELSGNWLLVTSATHMRRSVGSFCQAGWTRLVPWPTDHRTMIKPNPRLNDNLLQLNAVIREWVGLVGYRVTGKLADPKEGECLAEPAS
ncbi:MAG: YdcF family protein [Paracoccaceae bacterium]